ncbi:MAG: hypothetical protein BGO43_05650 [Gammaproteobacteria bacterium 39-13]|nr:response regulator [Gammaproteobacteria bacterium]OJV91522.1 MAG: hypothetical protein BGO43_05650 [Gammaproteobacteria bacterium 39-13]
MLESKIANLPGNILFVDDEENILKSLLRHFSGLGYQVFTANCGQDALNILNKENIDAIISDMRMPEMDGQTLLKEVSTKWPDISRILLTGYADLNSVISAVNVGKIHYCLTKPWHENQIEAIVKLSVETKHLKEKNKHLIKKVKSQNAELLKINDNLKIIVEERTHALDQALKKLSQNYTSLVKICSNLINIYDHKHRKHTLQVAELAVKIAKALKLPQEEINNIYFSGLLYNIGKIGLSKHLTETPYKTLATEEKRLFEQYPLLGATVLSSMDGLEDIVKIILAHRERYNGMGYPKKLSKDQIPLNTSILSIAIDYEQLQLGLILPQTLSSAQALAFIQSYRGIYYDPKLVDTLCNIVNTLPLHCTYLKEKAISTRMLSPGMVLSQDLFSAHKILLLPKGKVLSEDIINNLLRLAEMSVWVYEE